MDSKNEYAEFDIDRLLEMSDSEEEEDDAEDDSSISSTHHATETNAVQDNEPSIITDNPVRNYEDDKTYVASINRPLSSQESIKTSDSQKDTIMEPLGILEPLLDLLENPMDIEISNDIAPENSEDDKAETKKTEDSCTSSDNNKKDDKPLSAGMKRSIENILKNVGSQVRKQLSFTKFKKKKRNGQMFTVEGKLGPRMDVQKLPKTYPNQPKESVIETFHTDQNSLTPVIPFEYNPEEPVSNCAEMVTVNKFSASRTFNTGGLIMSLPDQCSDIILEIKAEKQPLITAVEQETETMKLENPKKWQKALIYNEKTDPKDFRRIFVYISGKIEMPGKKVLCLGYSPRGNILAIGGEGGMLKILEVEHSPNFIRTENPEVQDVAYKVLSHENLKGHMFAVQHLTWHSSGDRFTSSDVNGIIIGWINCNGMWIAEMVQDRNTSNVLGISWSPQSSHVAFTYKDINEGKVNQFGIVMGGLDGNREWNLDLGEFRPSPIAWLEETKWAVIYDNAISIYHSNGQKMQKRCLVSDGPSGEKIVAFFNKQDTTWTAKGTFSLAIVWKKNRMMLLRSINDPDNVTIRTQLRATCASWSPNGLFIAVGGKSMGQSPVSQVNIFSYVGKLVTMINISEPSLSSISWDLNSFHLAIGANNLLFFGKVRPVYKFASNGSVFAYAFTKDGINCVAFWDGEKLTIQKVPGTIVDLKNHDERFALLLVSDQGIYSASVLNKLGIPIDTLCILAMDPFAICLTDTCLVCLSSSAILFWRYGSVAPALKGFIDTKKNRKNIRQVHIDDSPAMIFLIGDELEDYPKTVIDPAVCMDAQLQYLCIARASGKLQFYHLPQGGLFRTFEIKQFNPYQLMFNPLADRLALLDMNGCLWFGTVSDSKIEINESKGTKEVINLMWAKDMEYHLCVMERTQMYILRNGKIEETFQDISVLQGYLAGFNDLKVTLLKLDDILDNPDEPSATHVTKFDLQIISKMKSDLQKSDNDHKFEKLLETVQKRNHPRLWKILAEGALLRKKFSIAEMAFIKGKNYSGVQFLKKIEQVSKVTLKRAEVHAFLEDYNKAEKYYINANQKNLAIKMWSDLGDCKRMDLLLNNGSGDRNEYHKKKIQALAEKHIENEEIEAALECFKEINNYQRILECCMMLEDFEGLQNLADSVPKKHPILSQIAATFAAVGMTTQAVKTYLANEDPQTAVAIALDNFQWNLALEVSQTYNIPIVAPILLNYTGKLIKVGDIMQAVQLLKRCDKTFAAGKLLVKVALQELQDDKPHLESVKKLFVMAAIALTTKPKQFLKGTKLRRTSTKIEDDDDIDLKFDQSIPEEYRPNSEELEWMKSTPWRGAHAVQYLSLVQKQIHRGHFEKATKAANHLKNYSDILGDERVNCMIALASANGENFYICSKALYQLESMSEDYYEDIAAELFTTKMDLCDKKTRPIHCPNCKIKLADYQATCESCGFVLPICIMTGAILSDDAYIWKCSTCEGTADSRRVKRVKFCPLCHTTQCFVDII